MMYAEQTREASGEILRLVIQKMAGHPAAFTPPTYTVWYEYAAGINPALSMAMRKLLDAGGKIDNETIAGLIRRHMSSSGQNAQYVQEELRKLLARLSTCTEETGKRTSSFGDNLQSYGDKLKQNLDQASLVALIGEMEEDTGNALNSMQDMQLKLDESRKEVEKLQQELDSARGEAMIDPLTEILNRRGFEIRAREIFAGEESIGGSCFLMIDIDHFKKVNDTYGHLFGDKVIRSVSEKLKSTLKGRDLVARFGGEEFAVLLPQTPVSGAYAVAESIRTGIEKGKIRRGSQDQIGGITVSIGIAESAADSSIAEALDRADKALYRSKEEGRNRTTIFL